METLASEVRDVVAVSKHCHISFASHLLVTKWGRPSIFKYLFFLCFMTIGGVYRQQSRPCLSTRLWVALMVVEMKHAVIFNFQAKD